MKRMMSMVSIAILVVTALAVAPPKARQLTILDLGTLGGPESLAFDINNRGQIVGGSTTAAGEVFAILWENGTITDLGTLGGTFGAANGINNRGQVVGESTTASGESHAFLWEGGMMTDLGTLPGGTGSFALGINDRGEVVGGSITAAGELHPVLWTKSPPKCDQVGLAAHRDGISVTARGPDTIGKVSQEQAKRNSLRQRRWLTRLSCSFDP